MPCPHSILPLRRHLGCFFVRCICDPLHGPSRVDQTGFLFWQWPSKRTSGEDALVSTENSLNACWRLFGDLGFRLFRVTRAAGQLVVDWSVPRCQSPEHQEHPPIAPAARFSLEISICFGIFLDGLGTGRANRRLFCFISYFQVLFGFFSVDAKTVPCFCAPNSK